MLLECVVDFVLLVLDGRRAVAHAGDKGAMDYAGDSRDDCRAKKDRRLPGDYVGGVLFYYNDGGNGLEW